MFFTALSLLSRLPSECNLAFWSFAIAFVASFPFLVRYFKMRAAHETAPFPFLELPAELRELIYDHLIQDPSYPPSRSPPRVLSSFGWLLPRRQGPSNSNWIMLANRQVYSEYMDILCKKSTFTLTVDQINQKEQDLWPIRQETLQSIRQCDLRIITTSSMLGAINPHLMPHNWPIRDKICESLQGMEKIEGLNLHVRAIGDPLWNPLWIWYHASQAFKDAGKLQFRSITFSLDSWSPGENHLARNKDGCWEWRCSTDHFVAIDPGQWQATNIREFCSMLYGECQACKGLEQISD